MTDCVGFTLSKKYPYALWIIFFGKCEATLFDNTLFRLILQDMKKEVARMNLWLYYVCITVWFHMQ